MKCCHKAICFPARGYASQRIGKNDLETMKGNVENSSESSDVAVALRKRQGAELAESKTLMSIFSLASTRMDGIRNEGIRGTAHVRMFLEMRGLGQWISC